MYLALLLLQSASCSCSQSSTPQTSSALGAPAESEPRPLDKALAELYLARAPSLRLNGDAPSAMGEHRLPERGTPLRLCRSLH